MKYKKRVNTIIEIGNRETRAKLAKVTKVK